MDLDQATQNAISYVRATYQEEPTFLQVQTHIINANFRNDLDIGEFLLFFEGGSREHELYAACERMGVKTHRGSWSKLDVSRLTFRQREIFSMLLDSPYSWLRTAVNSGDQILLAGASHERGYVFNLPHVGVVVKPHVRDEGELSEKAGILHCGPGVFERNEDYIVEEYAPLDKSKIEPILRAPSHFGTIVGTLLRTLHDNDMVYGDVVVSRVPPQVHLRVMQRPDGDEPILIDFGSSSFSRDVDLDIKKVIISLENICTVKGESPYMSAGLASFSRAYGMTIKRGEYPLHMSQMFT